MELARVWSSHLYLAAPDQVAPLPQRRPTNPVPARSPRQALAGGFCSFFSSTLPSRAIVSDARLPGSSHCSATEAPFGSGRRTATTTLAAHDGYLGRKRRASHFFCIGRWILRALS